MLHRPLYKLLGRFLRKNDRRRIASKILFDDSFQYGLENARFANSRSILLACDIHPSTPQSSEPNIIYLQMIPERIQNFKKDTLNYTPPFFSIYVPSDGLVYFAENILTKIDSSFILVSGDGDLPINTSSLGGNLSILLNHPLVLAWHAQNRDFDHIKLRSLPIGINIHNLWSNPLQWGGGFILPTMQELQIETIAQNAPPLSDRIPKIFCNWHFSIDRADRQSCYQHIDRSLCHFQETPLPVAKTWGLQAQYQFVLSPHGAGLDCHRTWEALILGCIVIVKTAKINDLFEDLAVVTVDEWEQITPNFLEASYKLMQAKKINNEKLFMQYWRKKLISQ